MKIYNDDNNNNNYNNVVAVAAAAAAAAEVVVVVVVLSHFSTSFWAKNLQLPFCLPLKSTHGFKRYTKIHGLMGCKCLNNKFQVLTNIWYILIILGIKCVYLENMVFLFVPVTYGKSSESFL